MKKSIEELQSELLRCKDLCEPSGISISDIKNEFLRHQSAKRALMRNKDKQNYQLIEQKNLIIQSAEKFCKQYKFIENLETRIKKLQKEACHLNTFQNMAQSSENSENTTSTNTVNSENIAPTDNELNINN